MQDKDGEGGIMKTKIRRNTRKAIKIYQSLRLVVGILVKIICLTCIWRGRKGGGALLVEIPIGKSRAAEICKMIYFTALSM